MREAGRKAKLSLLVARFTTVQNVMPRTARRNMSHWFYLTVKDSKINCDPDITFNVTMTLYFLQKRDCVKRITKNTKNILCFIKQNDEDNFTK